MVLIAARRPGPPSLTVLFFLRSLQNLVFKGSYDQGLEGATGMAQWLGLHNALVEGPHA